MNWKELYKRFLDSNSSQAEKAKIKEWMEAEKLSKSDLLEMEKIYHTSDKLKTYQNVNVEQALQKSIQRIEAKPKFWTLKKTYIALFGLLLISLFAWKMAKSNLENTIQVKTYYAETYQQIELQDGSSIELLANSTLNHNADLNSFELIGEAIFDIKKQPTPLHIDLPNGTIQVIGTKFLVQAAKHNSKVDLYQGKLLLQDTNKSKTYIIGGEKAVFNSEGIHTERYFEGALINISFQDKSLADCIKILEKLFHKTITYTSNTHEDIKITAKFTEASLEQILYELNIISGIDFVTK